MHCRYLSTGLFLILLAVSLVAPSVPVFASDGAKEKQDTVTVRVETRQIYSSDVEGTPGEIEITESKLNVSYGSTLSNQMPLALFMDIKHMEIDDSTAMVLPSHLESRSIGIGTKFPVPFLDLENYYMGTDIYPTMNTDGWDWEDSALRMPFRSYVIYKPSETFLFVAGVLVRIDYDEEVLPIIGFIYKPNDRLTFNFASDDPHVSYRINEKLTAFWELGFTYDEYEVTRQGKKGVILKYRETSTGAGLRYAVADVVDASLSAGGVFNRKLEYRDGTSWIEPEATPYARAKIDVHF